MRLKKALKSTSSSIDWQKAPDIQKRIRRLITVAGLNHFTKSRIYSFRSRGAKTRAYARIWGLSRIWQQALGITPAYVIEVISEKFDRLGEREKDKVLLHELAHIPMNFSGALMPHRHGKGGFHDKLKKMLAMYERDV